MRILLSVLLLLSTAQAAFSQQIKLPEEIKGAPGAWIIVAPEIIDGGKPKWRVDQNLQEVPLGLLLPPEVLTSLRGRVYQSTVPGRYKIEVWNAKADVPSEIYTCWVIIGDPPPIVVVPPPGPTPDPTPPPVVAGPRTAILFRESSKQTIQLADMIRDLNNPTHPAYNYRKSNGHSFYTVDPDQADVFAPWAAALAGFDAKTKPVLLIYDTASRNVLSKEYIEWTTGDANVIINALKKVGG